MQIENMAALVTGGASGLGEATAREIITRGGRCAVLDLPQSKGAALAEELGAAAMFCAADVCDEAAVQQSVNAACEKFGALHALVNCAGIGSAARTLNKEGAPFPLAVFKKTVEINLVGSFNALRLAAAKMAANGANADGERGVIINTASVAAFDGQIGQAAYSASKGGIVGMTLPVARDLAALGVRVCTIAPGLFETPLLALMPPEARAALGAATPFPKRLGRPAEYARLACDIIENPMLNGETIRLDGAIRMAPK